MLSYWVCIVFSVTFVSFLYVTLNVLESENESDGNDSSTENRRSNYEKPMKVSFESRNYKLILTWTMFCDATDWSRPILAHPDYFKKINCPETRCRILFSNQQDKFPITGYDAILFNGYNVKKGMPLPKERAPNQLYTFISKEPPFPWWLDAINFNITYNFTITYRPDSDMFEPYYKIIDIKTRKHINPFRQDVWRDFEKDFTDKHLINVARAKNKTIVAVISDCSALSGRSTLIKELQKHIDIDIFGKCGTLKCTQKDLMCSYKIDKEYKFYAAFENSLCENYVSEKFFNSLRRNIVPIVYGGGNYSNFGPPHSFIDVADYESYEALANYLKYLNEHPEEYVKYFWWKKYYTLEGNFINFCELCQRLHSPRLLSQSKHYTDIKKYWIDNACVHTAKNLSQLISSEVMGGSTAKLKKNIKRLIFKT